MEDGSLNHSSNTSRSKVMAGVLLMKSDPNIVDYNKIPFSAKLSFQTYDGRPARSVSSCSFCN